MRLIDADALDAEMYRKSFEVDDGRNVWNSGLWIRYKIFEEAIRDAPTVDAVPVIRCKDCKHRPVYDEQKREMPPRLNIEYDEDGEPWIWDDDMTCPYLCGDSYYNQMPDDEQFCDRGERKEE